MWWTFVAAAVGSLTALYIATQVYPQQKEVDRLGELRRERREAYGRIIREFLRVKLALDKFDCSTATSSKETLDLLFAARTSFENELLCAAMVATQSILSDMSESQKALDRLLSDIKSEAAEVLSSGSDGISGRDLHDRIKSKSWDAELLFERATENIVNTIRREEYGEKGGIALTSRTRDQTANRG